VEQCPHCNIGLLVLLSAVRVGFVHSADHRDSTMQDKVFFAGCVDSYAGNTASRDLVGQAGILGYS
jgi:hypothetical protein